MAEWRYGLRSFWVHRRRSSCDSLWWWFWGFAVYGFEMERRSGLGSFGVALGMVHRWRICFVEEMGFRLGTEMGIVSRAGFGWLVVGCLWFVGWCFGSCW